VGTEDGNIHKCSCSYNEQYLASYLGHSGPVNKVKYSKFQTDMFLSCSADWTIRLWNEHKLESPILTFETSNVSIRILNLI
jgi:hypothetical protein